MSTAPDNRTPTERLADWAFTFENVAESVHLHGTSKDALATDIREVLLEHTAMWAQSAIDSAIVGKAHAEILSLKEAIAKMDAIHTSIMENGPRCTCGDGHEWCARCGKSIKLSGIASRALKEDVS